MALTLRRDCRNFSVSHYSTQVGTSPSLPLSLYPSSPLSFLQSRPDSHPAANSEFGNLKMRESERRKERNEAPMGNENESVCRCEGGGGGGGGREPLLSSFSRSHSITRRFLPRVPYLNGGGPNQRRTCRRRPCRPLLLLYCRRGRRLRLLLVGRRRQKSERGPS